MSPAFELAIAVVGFLSLFLSGAIALLVSQMNETMKVGLTAQAAATHELSGRVSSLEERIDGRARRASL